MGAQFALFIPTGDAGVILIGLGEESLFGFAFFATFHRNFHHTPQYGGFVFTVFIEIVVALGLAHKTGYAQVVGGWRGGFGEVVQCEHALDVGKLRGDVDAAVWVILSFLTDIASLR